MYMRLLVSLQSCFQSSKLLLHERFQFRQRYQSTLYSFPYIYRPRSFDSNGIDYRVKGKMFLKKRSWKTSRDVKSIGAHFYFGKKKISIPAVVKVHIWVGNWNHGLSIIIVRNRDITLHHCQFEWDEQGMPGTTENAHSLLICFPSQGTKKYVTELTQDDIPMNSHSSHSILRVHNFFPHT